MIFVTSRGVREAAARRIPVKHADNDWTYEEYRERLDVYLRKQAQRKVLKTRRVERERVRQLGGGKAIAKMLLGPGRRKHR